MKVSVICMAYNHEKYIRSALEGFVNQKTDFEYEVFVHDDASKDGTQAIIREYAEKYPHIIKPILQTVNQYSLDINPFWGILRERSTGQYIATCEGDDYWIDENKLQMQVDFLDQHPEYSGCVHNSYLLDMSTNRKTVMYGQEDYDILPTHALNGGSCCYQTASKMYRREVAYNLPDFYYHTEYNGGFGDYPFAIHLALEGPIRYLGKVMSVYRVGTVSSWTIKNKKDMHENALFHKYVSEMLREVNEYTKFAYSKQIEALILYNDYQELYFDEKYEEMRQPKYQTLYSQESLVKRMKMRLKQYFAPVYHLYRKIRY